MASSCHVFFKPEKSLEEEVKRLKMCEDLFPSDLLFNKERFSSGDLWCLIKRGLVLVTWCLIKIGLVHY